MKPMERAEVPYYGTRTGPEMQRRRELTEFMKSGAEAAQLERTLKSLGSDVAAYRRSAAAIRITGVKIIQRGEEVYIIRLQ